MSPGLPELARQPNAPELAWFGRGARIWRFLPRGWRWAIFVTLTLAAAGTFIGVFSTAPAAMIARDWFITPIAVVAASFANATAVGGGFLFVPLFIFGFGLASSASLKLALATQSFGMTAGAFGWSPSLILRRFFVIASLAGGVGMWFGTYLFTPAQPMIKVAFGWVSIAGGIAVLIETLLAERRSHVADGSVAPLALFILVSLLGGVVTAWVAIGVGEVVALYLLVVYGRRIEEAVATGVAVLAAHSVLGFAFHAHLGGIPWEYLVFTAPGAAIGGSIGSRVGEALARADKRRSGAAHRSSPLRWLLIAVMVLDGTSVLLRVRFHP